MKKILTIIVAAYNVDKYLRKGCESCVLDMTWQDTLDVIIVNDGSNDNTSIIAHEFESRYPKIFRVIDKQNGHYGSCINCGIEQARGIYIKILDGDDAFDVSELQTLVERLAMIGEDRPDVVYCDCDWVDASGQITEIVRLPLEDGVYFEPKVLMSINNHIGHPQIVYRTEMLRINHYQQTEGCAYTDVEYYILPILWCRRFLYVHLSPMRILVERDGRSMATETYAKQFGVVAKLLLGLVKQWCYWEGRCAQENFEYVGELLRRDVRNVYARCISGICGFVPQMDLIAFDDELKKCAPHFYDSIETVCCFYGLKLNVVHEWRKSKELTWRLKGWNLYIKIVTWLAKIKQQLKGKSI